MTVNRKISLVAVDIRSTHNVGSFFRTCDGFGAELWLVGITPRPVYDDDSRLPYLAHKSEKAIAKTALGAEKTVKWYQADTLLECVLKLKKNGYRVVALEQTEDSVSIDKLTYEGPIAIVVGREVEGLDKVELSLCERAYEIPMIGNKESFNVSVAAGIALYQVNL